MKSNRVTIVQVAKRAGVSPTAVSFAFNCPEKIGEETAGRIFKVAQEMGYSPNPIARAMISRRTGVIGVLVPFSISSSFSNPFISAFMEGVGRICDARSLGALLVSPYKGSLAEATRRAPVDGYIVVGLDEKHGEVALLKELHIPFVVVDGDAETVSEINVDDEEGAFIAAKALLDAGHRDISILTFEQPLPGHEENLFYGVGGRRLSGYLRAFQDAGEPFKMNSMVQSLTSIKGGETAFSQIWQEGRRPTALLTMSDVMAIGAINAAKRLGVRVPEDIEVVGFDDIPLSALIQPSLTTIHQPIVQKGRRAAELLVNALEGSAEPKKELLHTHLVVRRSTRSVRAADIITKE